MYLIQPIFHYSIMILMEHLTGFLKLFTLLLLFSLANPAILITNPTLPQSYTRPPFYQAIPNPHQHSRNLQQIALVTQTTLQQKAKITIGNAKKSILNLSDKVNGFENLPGEKELEEMTRAVDVFVIAKTVKVLVEKEDIDCENKLVYLSELRALIVNQISEHKSTLAEQQIIQRKAQQQLKRFLIQLNLELQSLDQLGISSYEDKINIQISSLEYIYDLHHQINLEIQITLHNIEKVKARIQRREYEFEELVNYKKRLQVDPRQNITQKLVEIRRIEGEIVLKEGQLAKEKNDFFFNEAYLNRKKTESSRLRRIYLKLQIQIERTRTVLFSLKEEEKKIRSSIEKINQQLQIHRKNANSGIPQALQERMHKLQLSLKEIQQQFAVLHYYCFQLNFDQNGTQYEHNIDKFRVLVQDIYQLDPKKIQNLQDIEQVYIMPIDIFSSKWKTQYNPTQEEHIVIINVGVDQNGPLEHSFTCIQPFSIITQEQTEDSSFESCIIVKDENGIQYNAYVGLCTKLRKVNEDKLIGERIFWKGNRLERAVSVSTGQCI